MNKDMVLILRDDGHELRTAEYAARYDLDGKRTIAMGLYEKSPFSFRIERATEDKATGWAIAVKDGKVFIKDAFIGSGIVSANYNVKLNINNDGKEHAAGMAVGVEGGQGKDAFRSDRLKVNEAASSIVRNAVASNTKMKTSLSDEMKSAIIDAVLESKQFVENEVANVFSLNAGQVIFLTDRFKVLGNAMSIPENAVLRDVLVNVLSKDHCPVDGLEDKAIKLAKAVQAAFDALVQEDATAN